MPDEKIDYRREQTAAVEAARAAGAMLEERFGQVLQIAFKGATDLVTDADQASEDMIASHLLAEFPEDQFLGEERGSDQRAEAGRWWVVDPIDGTTNYTHGYPLYAVSIALVVDGITEVGAVYIPRLDEMFSVTRGNGATLNGQPIRVSDADTLASSLVATGFPYDRGERHVNIPYLAALLETVRAVRRSGVAAFDLCCVACGRLEGYWERGTSAWDVAAGVLLVEEAGGIVTNYRGDKFGLFDGEVLAATPTVHDSMTTVMRKVQSD